MASKLLFKHLRTVTRPTRHLVTSPNFTAPLVHNRLYANAAPLAPSTPPAPPPVDTASLDAGKPLPNSKKVVKTLGSVNEAEIAKFAALAEKWWELEGPYKALHLMNPTRLSFIRSTLSRHFGKDQSSARPLEGLKILDVGCGGGILSEPLARLGADVTGVDAAEKNINVARVHAGLDPITSLIKYQCTTAEQLVEEQKKFDVVIASEVIEHVANPEDFCKSLSELSNPGGAIIMSTINRSIRGYAAAIVMAEYILQWLPKETHDWTKFVTPEELALTLQRNSVTVQELAGIVYDPLTSKWLLSDDTGVNYILFATKDIEESNEIPDGGFN